MNVVGGEIVRRQCRIAAGLFCAALWLLGQGCRREHPAREWVKLPAELNVELARTPEERERGLMFRQHLPKDQGMYFVFEAEERLSFYMRNTRIPLSIAFIGENDVIESIRDMVPLDESSVFSRGPVRFALEANKGWFAEHGIRPGDRVTLEGNRVVFFRRTSSGIGEYSLLPLTLSLKSREELPGDAEAFSAVTTGKQWWTRV
jgi:uncharacterized membrane protein (UPF0127 family)